jgi:aspartate/tyrosine/aromatic aminotransferase
LLRRVLGVKSIWLGTPTWANHPQIYAAAQLELNQFPYLYPNGIGVNFNEILNRLAKAQAGEALLLHTVCHNPTGFDFTAEQWDKILDLILDKQLIPRLRSASMSPLAVKPLSAVRSRKTLGSMPNAAAPSR